MKFSIIVPMYHGNAYLDSLIHIFKRNQENLIQQRPADTLELVLVNDSPEIPLAIEETKDIKIYNNEHNVGIHQSRIHGYHVANGDYLTFLDQDDKIDDDFIIRQYECLEDGDIVVCNAYDKKDGQKIAFYHSLRHQSCVKELKWYLCATNQIISPGQCLIKKSKIPQIWLETPLTINGADDMLLWVTMLLEKAKFKINERIAYTHVSTGQNVSNDAKGMNDSKISVYEILNSKGLLSKKESRDLRRCIKWKAFLYSSHGRILKLFYSLLYLDMVVKNIHFQLIKRRVLL